MTDTRERLIGFVLCAPFLAVCLLAGQEQRTALTVGGVLGANLGEYPGAEVGLTLTRGRVESQTVFDATQKRMEPGFSRTLSERVTARVGPLLGGLHVNQRFGAWHKWTLWYLFGVQHGRWSVDYRGELASSFSNETQILEGRYRIDRGRLRVEVLAGIDSYQQDGERRIGGFQILRVGRLF